MEFISNVCFEPFFKKGEFIKLVTKNISYEVKTTFKWCDFNGCEYTNGTQTIDFNKSIFICENDSTFDLKTLKDKFGNKKLSEILIKNKYVSQ